MSVFFVPLRTLHVPRLDHLLLDVRNERGPLVKSTTTTQMIYRLGNLFDVPVHETAVGFKYLGPVMRSENALAAGEESGGYAFRGHIPERDGILSGLYLLNLSCGIVEGLPDILPIVGNLDEVTVSAFFFGCLSYLGINLIPFRKDRKEQPVELNTNSSDD